MAKNKGGRPPIFDKEIAFEICEKIADGEVLSDICKLKGFPSLRTVRYWILEGTTEEGRPEIKEFLHTYMQAQELGADIEFDDMRNIADECDADLIAINKAKLRIDVRKFRVVRRSRKKYGDKQEIEHSGDLAIPAISVNVLPKKDE